MNRTGHLHHLPAGCTTEVAAASREGQKEAEGRLQVGQLASVEKGRERSLHQGGRGKEEWGSRMWLRG